jgi:hypothetical protein
MLKVSALTEQLMSFVECPLDEGQKGETIVYY